MKTKRTLTIGLLHTKTNKIMSSFFQSCKNQMVQVLKNAVFCGVGIVNAIQFLVTFISTICLLNGLPLITDYPVLYRLAIYSLLNACVSIYWCFYNGCFREYDSWNAPFWRSVQDFYYSLDFCAFVGAIMSGIVGTVTVRGLNFIFTVISPATLFIGIRVILLGPVFGTCIWSTTCMYKTRTIAYSIWSRLVGVYFSLCEVCFKEHRLKKYETAFEEIV